MLLKTLKYLLAKRPPLKDVVQKEKLKHPRNAVTLQIPSYRQLDDYSCGFAAGLTVFKYFFPRITGNKFYDICRANPLWGTSETKLIQSLRHCDVTVHPRKELSFEDITEYIQKGYPIIVTINMLGEPGGHWVVIYGTSQIPKRIFVSGGWQQEYTWRQFVRNWYERGDGLVCSKRKKS